MKNTVLIFFLLLVCASCQEKQQLFITNSSTKTIYFTYSPSPKLKDFDGISIYGSAEGDTTYNFDNTSRIRPNETNEVLTYNSWDQVIDEDFGGKIYFYFFEEETLRKYPWQNIVRWKLYSQVQEYDTEDLIKINWRIKYPN